jgi:cellulose biosynthesis protein BcsQ
MAFFESIDWASVVDFFDHNSGKFITTLFALLVAIISLVIAYLKYHHGKSEDSVRRQLEKLLKQKQAELEAEEALRQKRSALHHIDTVLSKQRDEISKRETALNIIRAGFKGKEGDLWCMHRTRVPGHYDRLHEQGRKPIILVANLKGGVGKSTLTANLAAYFDQMGKRVLLLDCDYQGSLSNMVLSADGEADVPFGMIEVLSPNATGRTFEQARRRLSNILPNTSIVPARYELASLENRVLIEYLLQEDKNDGRYRLAEAMLSDQIKDSYDIAFIDTPPRLTAATINAFRTSTHLLIPTLYDGMSSEAVGTFYAGVRTLRNSLNSGIEILGVVGMLTAQSELKQQEIDSRQKARQQIVQAWQTDIHFFDRHIPRRAAIARAAGEKIAFYDDANDARVLFSALGDEISYRLGFSAGSARRDGGYAQSQANLRGNGASGLEAQT